MRQSRITRDGVGLHVVEWGAAEGKTLLCLHGITGNARAFDGIARELASERRAVAFDLRGRGESDAPETGYGIAAHVADALAVLDGLGIEQAAVVGWSLGALIGLHLAAGAPERVARLALLDPPLTAMSPLARESLGRVQARLTRTYPSMEAAIAELRDSPSAPREWSDALAAYFSSDLAPQPDGSVRHRLHPDVPAREREGRVAPLSTVLPRVVCPTLILRASEPLYQPGDQLLTAEDAARAARLLPDGATRDVPSNHYTIALGEPSATIAALRAFLA